MNAPNDKTGCPVPADARRIVNIYNFIRACEPRYPAVSRDVLLETTARQIRGVRELGLPATFALQYDALIDSRYQELLRRELPDNCEIGAWWEIVQPQVEKAGLAWRGRYPYENEGYRPKVIFPTGLIDMGDGTCRIYYGASDTVMAMATARIDDLIALCRKNTR